MDNLIQITDLNKKEIYSKYNLPDNFIIENDVTIHDVLNNCHNVQYGNVLFLNERFLSQPFLNFRQIKIYGKNNLIKTFTK